jgi:hypothetical protein
VAALAAAVQLRHDDSLAWALAVCVAASVVAASVAAHTVGLPGHRPVSWGLDAPVLVALSAAVLGAATHRARSGRSHDHIPCSTAVGCLDDRAAAARGGR